MKVIGHYNTEKRICVINSFMGGVRRYGHRVETHLANGKDKIIIGDYHIILGWDRFSPKFLRSHLLPRLVIYGPPLRNVGFKYHDDTNPDKYYAVTKTEINNFTPYKKMPSDRWELFNKKLKFIIKPWRKKGDHIIIAHKPDLDEFGNDRQEFYEEAIRKSLDTGRRVMCCAHPTYYKNRKKRKYMNSFVELINKFKHTDCEFNVGIDKYLPNARCLISAGGSTVVSSVLAGIPAYSYEKNSLIDPVTLDDLSKFIIHPPTPRRRNWLNWIAYQHWTLGEMKRGLPWVFLTKKS